MHVIAGVFCCCSYRSYIVIRFGTQQSHTCSALIYFYDNQLSFLDAVVHLGHHLSFDLSDTIDILHKTRELVKKSNLE